MGWSALQRIKDEQFSAKFQSEEKPLFYEKLCTEGLSGNLLAGWVTETSHLLWQENKSPWLREQSIYLLWSQQREGYP